MYLIVGRDSSVGMATGYRLDGLRNEFRGCEIFRTCPDRPWGPRSFLHNGYRVIPVGTGPGLDVDHPPPSSA